MNNFNPMNFVQMIKQGQNPQQLMLGFLEQNFSGTPMGQNLLQMAKKGDTAGIEQFARNLYGQSGKDFDKDFISFRQMFGL